MTISWKCSIYLTQEQKVGFNLSLSTFSPLLSNDCARTLTCSLAHCLSSCLFSYFFNNYLLKTKWTLLNNPWDKVKEIIQQYLLSIIEFSIIAHSGDFEFSCKFFVFVDCSVTIDLISCTRRITVNSPSDQLADANSPTYKIE